MKNTHKLIEFIVTAFYLGKIKIMPGTWGSLGALPIIHGLAVIFLSSSDSKFYCFMVPTIFIFILILFFLGLYCTDIYIKSLKNKDPREIVIDELVGQMLVIVGINFSFTIQCDLNNYLMRAKELFYFLVPFLLFRFFDIVKPWPINLVNSKMKNAFGVMFDDILAAIFAIFTYYITYYFYITLK